MMAFDGRTAEDIKIRLLTAWRTDGVNLCDSACTLNRIHSVLSSLLAERLLPMNNVTTYLAEP
jgi:hypothetical protein